MKVLCDDVRKAGYSDPKPEHPFHPTRKFKFDLAWIEYKVAFEREGGTAGWGKSRHSSEDGYESDCQKYNLAATLGWVVIRGTAKMLVDGTARDHLLAALKMRSKRQ